jgi:hypothetical protein
VPRRLAISAFVATALTAISAAHYYLARRLILDPAFPDPLGRALLALLFALFAATLFRRLVARWFPALGRGLSWVGFVWMGFLWLLLVSVGTADLLLVLSRATGLPAAWADATAVTIARWRAGVSFAAAIVLAAASIRSALALPALRRVEIALSRWPAALDGFRILQVSDVHIGAILGRRFAASIVERVNAREPDLVAMTGDLVDGSVERLAAEVEPFRRLSARHGVFFITGNHDYYSGADPWVEFLTGLGIRALRNQRVVIGANGASFELAGVDDLQGRFFGENQGEDLASALDGRDPTRALVLLAHQPMAFRRAAAHGIDLQLSGHTHGGQIWPFRYLVRLFTPYVAGHYRHDDSQLYVSRGTGFWGPPMRFLAPAEITEIVLRSGTLRPN